MAIHIGHLPHLRQAPARRRYVEERKPRTFSLEKPLASINAVAADSTARLHATGAVIIGVVTLWVAIGLF